MFFLKVTQKLAHRLDLFAFGFSFLLSQESVVDGLELKSSK
jgi:hypothetical protein